MKLKFQVYASLYIRIDWLEVFAQVRCLVDSWLWSDKAQTLLSILGLCRSVDTSVENRPETTTD